MVDSPHTPAAHFDIRSLELNEASSVNELSEKLLVPTRLGAVSFHARVIGPSLSKGDISLWRSAFRPKLPPRMSVSACTAVLLKVRPEAVVRAVWLEAELATGIRASPCTGEYLDAQEWGDGQNLVVIGTEDGLALDVRYPGLDLAELAAVDLAPQTITLRLDLPIGLRGPSFHFIVAENSEPESVELSAWFAVDQPHETLLRLK